MNKTVIGSIAAVVALALGYIGFLQYADGSRLSAMVPHAQAISVRIATQARYQSGELKSSPAEYLERVQADVAEADSRIIALQTLPLPRDKAAAAAVLDYATQARNFLQALGPEAKTRHALAEATAEAAALTRKANSHFYEKLLLKGKLGRAQAELKKVTSAHEAALAALTDSYGKLKTAQETAAKHLPKEALPGPEVYAGFDKAFAAHANGQ